jgi:Ca-activated chloride channel homolog
MMSQELLRINVQASRHEVGASDTAQLLYLLAEIQPPDVIQGARLPLNLCLLIDRSTSMRGDRLDRVKAAATLIVDKLAPNDVVSVVAFSDRAEAVLPAGRLTNKAAIMGRIRAVTASGGTEIYQGMVTAIEELRKAVSTGHVNHLILMTDGHTYGDSEACLALAERASREGIGINAFGIGPEWNDEFLDQLVAPSAGRSAYIETPAQIITYLQECIEGLGSIYAQNLRLLYDFPVGVRLRYAFKLSPFAQPLPVGTQETKLGAVEGNSLLTILLELVVEPQLPGKALALPLQLVADIPSQNLHDYVTTHLFELRTVVESEIESVPEALITAVRSLNLYRMNEQVWQEVESGELDTATMRLRRLTTRLLEAGQTQLAQQAYAETERLVRMGTLSLEGRKRLKYGTRSLMTHSFHMDET